MTRRLEPALLVSWTMVTAALAFSEVDHPVRTLFTLVFVALVPGLALIRLVQFEGFVTRLMLAVPTSLCLAALVSAILVYSGVPSWNLGLSALISGTVGCVILDIGRRSGQKEPRIHRRKLDDEGRQAALVQALLDGGTLSDAATAAGVSEATLHRSLRSSNQLRRAVLVATHGDRARAGLMADSSGRTQQSEAQ